MLTTRHSRGRGRGRPFSKGPDSRRHGLTNEERSRGGQTTWARYMIQWHGELFGFVPDPIEEPLLCHVHPSDRPRRKSRGRRK